MSLFNAIILFVFIYLLIGYFITKGDVEKDTKRFERDPLSINMEMYAPVKVWMTIISVLTWPMCIWEFIHAFWIVFKRKNNIN